MSTEKRDRDYTDATGSQEIQARRNENLVWQCGIDYSATLLWRTARYQIEALMSATRVVLDMRKFNILIGVIESRVLTQLSRLPQSVS